MRYTTGLLALLLGAGVPAAQAQLNLGLLAGIREESGPEGSIGAVGFTADFGGRTSLPRRVPADCLPHDVDALTSTP